MAPGSLGVHLVGSVPLIDAETVFRTVSAAIGSHLERLPDGETGFRKDWIAFQFPRLAAAIGLEPTPAGDRVYLRRQMVHRVQGSPAPHFGPLGYASAALDSFALFERLQKQGVIPRRLRFQVSLPTPLAPMTTFVAPGDRAAVEPAYEARMMAEVQAITSGIPHERLAIQWDVAAEFGHLEGLWPAHFPALEQGILERLLRIGRAVPDDVELGYHLCYGDFGHRHFVNPESAETLVRIANALSAAPRPIAWLHVPVPASWTEPRSYAPLAKLKLQPQTQLYLGVVHLADGIQGARQRLARARELVEPYGIATECGWGRRPPETVPELLRLHAELVSGYR